MGRTRANSIFNHEIAPSGAFIYRVLDEYMIHVIAFNENEETID